jgi:hypothetical protein
MLYCFKILFRTMKTRSKVFITAKILKRYIRNLFLRKRNFGTKYVYLKFRANGSTGEVAPRIFYLGFYWSSSLNHNVD